jgi:excisionase family DNA binding protein
MNTGTGQKQQRIRGAGVDKILLTTQEAADALGIGRVKLYSYLGKGLPVVRIGRSVRVHVDDVRKFAEAMREEARRGDAA